MPVKVRMNILLINTIILYLLSAKTCMCMGVQDLKTVLYVLGQKIRAMSI